MEKTRPTSITADRTKRELIITWNDGKECRYPYTGLRAVCPCAECQGGHENMGQPADKELLYGSADTGVTIDNVEAVGSYALGILWSDGHWQGIYTWPYLHEACRE